MLEAPLIGTMDTPSSASTRPRRNASTSSAARSLSPSTKTTVRHSGAASGGTIMARPGNSASNHPTSARSPGSDRAEAAVHVVVDDADVLHERVHTGGADEAISLRADVQRILREAGVRRARWSTATPPAATGLAALTQAEHRVATLRAVFTTLGVRSRAQLANALR